MTPTFETRVQELKYKVLREVARQAWADTLTENLLDLPKIINPGKVPTMRCCIYKERAILGERIKLIMNGNRTEGNVIRVLPIACDDCPTGGYEVTDACRGCLAHRCESACKKNAVYFDGKHTAHIDKDKCVNCGACAKACLYSAIINRRRPCQNACKVNAITMDEDYNAAICDDKCTACGACVADCPFGAIVDTSEMLDVIALLRQKERPVYALLAPAYYGQFPNVKQGQVSAGLYRLGFSHVVEAALGADMVAQEETAELIEKGRLISSCCPAFVSYVQKNFPELSDMISNTLSPMATMAKAVKMRQPDAAVVFVGPCTAKKKEAKSERVSPYVDAVITLQELQALFDSRDIDIDTLEEENPTGASGFGRGFAKCGGLAEAVAEGIKEKGSDFVLKAQSCDGLDACKNTLLLLKSGKLDANFIEGMACVGGCVGGAGCILHGEKAKKSIDVHKVDAGDKTIADAVNDWHKND